MLPVELAQSSAVVAACRRFGVTRLDLFGSAADGRFDPARSDLDFLVAFSAEARTRAFDNFFGLKETLEEIFERPVDLLTEGSIRSERMRAEIERNRRMVYAA